LNDALRQFAEHERYLLEFDLSERCIAAKLASYLQARIPDYVVDVEYNREGATPNLLTIYDFRRPPELRAKNAPQVCGLDYIFTLTVRSVAVRR
jgi:hypothetical protein